MCCVASAVCLRHRQPAGRAPPHQLLSCVCCCTSLLAPAENRLQPRARHGGGQQHGHGCGWLRLHRQLHIQACGRGREAGVLAPAAVHTPAGPGPPLLDALLAAEPGLRVRASWALEGESLISDGRPLLLLSRCSQTIFTMRAGVFNRWNGWVVAISEFVMFALPFPGGMRAGSWQCVAGWVDSNACQCVTSVPPFQAKTLVPLLTPRSDPVDAQLLLW